MSGDLTAADTYSEWMSGDLTAADTYSEWMSGDLTATDTYCTVHTTTDSDQLFPYIVYII